MEGIESEAIKCGKKCKFHILVLWLNWAIIFYLKKINIINFEHKIFLFRTTKNWKKIKEISEKDDKRPPWRMASVSTLPKADKSALLRAKLLDASR